MKGRDKKASAIAAAVTFAIALIVLLLLFTLSLKFDREALATESIPEIQDEEIYLEPEILQLGEPGDLNAEENDASAPQTPGEPDPGEIEQPERVVKNAEPNPDPVSNKPKLVASSEPSEVKTSAPKVKSEDEKRIESISGKLKTDNNGSRTGSESAVSGSGGVGVSKSGNVHGRRMLSCPTTIVTLNQTTTITVAIVVNAEGRVVSARATSGGTEKLRSACVSWAKGSKWTAAPGAPDASGTITFTITPK